MPNEATSPFRGIRPFRYVDRENYFGQQTAVEDLYAKVLLYRLTVLFGESGTGKSSLLNAALVPALCKEGLTVELARVRPDAAEPILITRIPATENENGPFLPSIFASDTAERYIPCSLNLLLRTLTEKAASSRPVFVLDQCEELFTLFEHKTDGEQVRQTQERLLDVVHAIVTNATLPVKVILVIRDDFLGKLEILAKRYPQVLDHRVRLRALAADAARMAITGPFGKPDRYGSKLTEALALRIVDELSIEASDRLVSPTQLQIVCIRLWDTYAGALAEIAESEYEKLGGVAGIVNRFFGDELKLLDTQLQPLAITLLGSLITESGTRDVISEGKLRSLTGGADETVVHKLLDDLERRRLINKTSQRRTYFYEIASEYLIPPIEAGARLQALERARAVAEIQRVQSEQKLREAQRFTGLALILAGAIALALLASGFAWWEWYKIHERDVITAKQATQAVVNNARVGLATTVAEQGQTEESLRAALHRLRTSDSNGATAGVNSQRVYIQVRNADERRQATALSAELRRAGFDVPDIATLTFGPATTEIRYFQLTQEKQAEKVAYLLRQKNVIAKPVPLLGYGATTSSSFDGHLELWLAPETRSVEGSAVIAGLLTLNKRLNGWVPFMYMDIKQLVTVGCGNLIDPLSVAQALPFRFRNKPGIAAPGSLATPEQIAAEWQMLKNNLTLAQKGYLGAEPITNLELSDDVIESIALNRISQNEAFLKRQIWFKDFDTWPADAQMGLLSMAWAMGPGGPGGFPTFRNSCQNMDFAAAALESKMNETDNPELVERNSVDRILFENAAAVILGESSRAYRRTMLYYPTVLPHPQQSK